jgi:VMA21-like domain
MKSLSDSFRNQVILCTSLMIIIPMSTFFYLRTHLAEKWIPSGISGKDLVNLESDVDMWSALGAIVSVQFVIMGIVIVKYYDDILDVFCRGRGHLEYNEDGTTRNVRF